MMIKRSSILLLFLLLGSVTYLVYASGKTDVDNTQQNTTPVRCSEKCEKLRKVPVQWNLVSPTILYTES